MLHLHLVPPSPSLSSLVTPFGVSLDWTPRPAAPHETVTHACMFRTVFTSGQGVLAHLSVYACAVTRLPAARAFANGLLRRVGNSGAPQLLI